VYKGCASPLIVDWPQTCKYDRLGKSIIPDVDPVDTSVIQPEHASVALCRLVSQDPGRNITLHFLILTKSGIYLFIYLFITIYYLQGCRN